MMLGASLQSGMSTLTVVSLAPVCELEPCHSTPILID